MYSISEKVLAGSINAELLRKEIEESGAVENFDGITVSNGFIDIRGGVVDEDALLAILAAHVPYPLSTAKSDKNASIDTRTRAIIAKGFPFDGQVFSLSSEAQTNWIGLYIFRDLFTWPVRVTTRDDKQYSLELPAVVPFVATGSGLVAEAIRSGRELKLRVNVAASIDEVDAVQDPR